MGSVNEKGELLQQRFLKCYVHEHISGRVCVRNENKNRYIPASPSN